ncbi:MAG TPA: DNA polymerase/3'-5' exonuclease PolX [Gemmatimonadales bacterium]
MTQGPSYVENDEIARRLMDVGLLLQIQGANPFRVRAYENAARTVETHATPMHALVEAGADLTDLPAVGKDMARHIHEMVTTGHLSVLDELSKEIPRTLIDMIRLPGVGPKRAKKLWQSLGVQTIEQLEAVAQAGAVQELEGFGLKTEQRILQGIANLKQRQGRFKLSDADALIGPLLAHLRAHPGVQRVEVAGSYRRRVETVGDIDLLAIADDAESVMDHFTTFPRVKRVEKSGGTRGTVILSSDLQVDLRIVPAESYGAALQYFTGSKAHNVKFRTKAVARGLRVSEYGVFEVDPDQDPETADPRSGRRVAGDTEASVYAAVGLPWIPAELREDRGEIAAAERGTLPSLVTVGAMRGDLQMHSTWSDGKHSIEEMLVGCAARGYEYFALTDHSKSLAMTGGLDEVALREQWREIDDVTARHPEIRLLRSMEIDILRDGSLDLADEMIAQLDIAVVSIHSLFDLPSGTQTARIVKALEHAGVHVLAHPTGRLINRREPIAFDLDAVLQCAKAHNVAVELNAHPNRLDLKDTQVVLAREMGVRVVISTDAHRVEELDLMRYGVEQARRAWLEPAHVLNTLPLPALLATLG